MSQDPGSVRERLRLKRRITKTSNVLLWPHTHYTHTYNTHTQWRKRRRKGRSYKEGKEAANIGLLGLRTCFSSPASLF